MLNNPIKVERVIGGRTLTIETNKLAKQAGGSVTVRYGDTMVLTAATFGREKPFDFFPLTCDYREKTYAAGRFPGGYFKREGRPNTKEILTSRLCDRPHRPLFPKGFRNELAIMMTALSADGENDPDILAMVGASSALSLCEGQPYMGPTGSIRLGRIGGEFIVNPTHEERALSDLDLVVAGLENAIAMVEGGANEVSEEVMLDALDFAMGPIREIIAMQRELVEKAGRKMYTPPASAEPTAEETALEQEVTERFYAKVQAANSQAATGGKSARRDALKAVRTELLEVYADAIEAAGSDKAYKALFYKLERRAVRGQILDDGVRADGRGLTDIREIEAEVSFLPRTHGSALFTRGETQAIVTVTLGGGRDTQRIDGLITPYEKAFMLQYNFPPYCVGETWPYRGPRRREIGHGALAERAVSRVVPDAERFPYTIRVVSEITESNGSSSMATVCGGTLALMDAGVPIKRPVAGIAMGLVAEGDRYAVLSDILGLEDHDGDMDFKVAGTQAGITAFQMDAKVQGIPREVMAKALSQARDGRLHILRTMLRAIDRPRDAVSEWAPRLVQVSISRDKIGALIGPGGKNIRRIQEETSCTIEINDEAGTATVLGGPGSDIDECVRQVRLCTEEVEVGKIYKGKVVSVRDFGIFVELLPGTEGMCHVSELSTEFVKSVSDVCKVGEVVEVKVISIDAQGRVRISRKQVMLDNQKQETNQKQEPAVAK